MAKVNYIPAAPQAAVYGGTGQTGGALQATNAGLDRVNNNNEQQKLANQGAAAANGQFQTDRGPGAQQDAGLANNVAGGANGNQAGAIELARRQAMGQQPSAAAYQMQAGLNAASDQQSAMAAGARGSAALSTASANQNANTSNLQQNAYLGAGMLRSQEMAQGRGMYNSLTGDQRNQQQQQLGEANAFGLANQGATDAHRLAMGNAAVNFGGVANGLQGQDFTNTVSSFDPMNAQDEANQAMKEQIANNRKQAVAANIEDG